MNINTIFAQAQDEIKWEQELANTPAAMTTKFVSANGLALLAEAGQKVWEEATCHALPHNLIRSQMSGSVGQVGRHGRRLPEAEADVEIEHFARFGGWLREAASFKALRKAIERGQSYKGLNSFQTLFDLEEFFKLYKSPGAANHALWKCRDKAVTILSAYATERRPSWGLIAMALIATRGNTRKAAVIAVAGALYDYGYGYKPSYREARQLLADGRTARFTEVVIVNGTEYRYDNAAEAEQDCATAHVARFITKYGTFGFTLVVKNDDQLVVSHAIDGEFNNSPVFEDYELKNAITRAECTWKEGKEIEEYLFVNNVVTPYGFEVTVVDKVPNWMEIVSYKFDYALHAYEKHWDANNSFLIMHGESEGKLYIRDILVSKNADHSLVAAAIEELGSNIKAAA